ncbi:phosphatase [Tenacibaculum sp. C7A-26P2]|uniref:phosphatase n=1 Tax=Tenacibaculum sp. C7A-26P2 TaxID=3447504 RepID=UPI003F86025B
MKKNYFTKAMSVLLVGLIACEDGIDGKNGMDGADGTNGSDATLYLSTSKTPNFLKVTNAFSHLKIHPILSSEDVIPNSPDFVYGSMADGGGLLAAADGTFTYINNIEADYSIARIQLNAQLRPVSGEYILNAVATANTAQCSGSLITPDEHGFGPYYLSGGEWGGSSKGVFLTEPNKSSSEAGSAKMLTNMGQWSTENAVAIGEKAYLDKTVVFIGDDNSDNNVPSGQLGMYVGNKGDLEGGKLYGLKVTSPGVTYEMDMSEGIEYEAEFVELTEKEITALDTECKTKGVMGFSRLEDIDWRRGSAVNNRELYFAVTGRNKPGLVGKGTIYGRVYKVVLNENDPTGSATITCILDGDKIDGKAKAFHSPDNICVTENYVYIQEDPNGYFDTADKTHWARLYQYNLTTGALKVVLECNQEVAASKGYGTVDKAWEITGMIDVTKVVNNGKNTFMVITQNHGWEPSDGTAFTDSKANADVSNSRKEGSVLHLITGLER